MTLIEEQKLIDDMIKENPDTTIKDFLELKSEITGIEKSVPVIRYTPPEPPPIVKVRGPGKRKPDKATRKYYYTGRLHI